MSSVKSIKIFGQEPAAAVGLLEALLVVLLTFGVSGLSQDRVADIVAVVTAVFGLLAAWATKDTLLSAIVGFAKSALVLAAAYGLKLSNDQTGALMALITLAGGFYLRSWTSSVTTPISNVSTGSDVAVNMVADMSAVNAELKAQVKHEVQAQLGKSQG